MNKSDLKIEFMRGTGPGGQRKNKRDTACRITHIPTGIQSYADERTQPTSQKVAMRELEGKLKAVKAEQKAKDRKARRDNAIHNTPVVRTYDFKRNSVKDHRTGKEASINDILNKGKLEKLR